MPKVRRCGVCGADHVACGGPTATTTHRPVDELITPEGTTVTEKRQRYHVKTSDRRNATDTIMLLTAKEAKQYPGARLADRQPGDRPADGLNAYEGATMSGEGSDQAADGLQGDANAADAQDGADTSDGDVVGSTTIPNKARRTK